MCDVIIQCLVQQIIKLLCGTIFCKLICIKHQAKIHSFLALIYLAIIIILLTCLNKNEWYEYIDILILLILLLYSLSNVYNIWDLEYNYYRYAVAYQILDFKKLKEIAPNNVYVDLPTQKENFNMSLRLAPNGYKGSPEYFSIGLSCDFIEELEGCIAKVLLYDHKNTCDFGNVLDSTEGKSKQFFFRINSKLPKAVQQTDSTMTATFKGFRLEEIEERLNGKNSFKILFMVYKPHKTDVVKSAAGNGYELMDDINISINENENPAESTASSLIKGTGEGKLFL